MRMGATWLTLVGGLLVVFRVGWGEVTQGGTNAPPGEARARGRSLATGPGTC
jgi:hypothetical protein